MIGGSFKEATGTDSVDAFFVNEPEQMLGLSVNDAETQRGCLACANLGIIQMIASLEQGRYIEDYDPLRQSITVCHPLRRNE